MFPSFWPARQLPDCYTENAKVNSCLSPRFRHLRLARAEATW
jgi:hypothetical protein